MISGIGSALVGNQADVNRVPEDGVELAATEWPLPECPAGRTGPRGNLDPFGRQRLRKHPDGTEAQVAGENLPDDPGVVLDDGEAAPLGAVAEGRGAPHPHPAGLRGCDFVPDTLGRDLPLELGEGQQHVEG